MHPIESSLASRRIFGILQILFLLTTAAAAQTLDWVNQPLAPNVFGGADEGRAIARDASGNVYVTGYFYRTADFDPGAGTASLTSAGNQDIFIAKYDVSGNYIWAKRLGAGASDSGYGLALDGSGNVHVTGFFNNTVDFDPGAGTANLTSAGNQDIFIAKYDASGNYVWAKSIGGASGDFGNGLALDGSGNVHVTGRFQGTADFDPGAGTANLASAGSTDIFIAKYDASGNYVWAKRIGSTSADSGASLALDGSGNVHVTGYFNGTNVDFDPGAGTVNLSSAGNHDIFIAKYDVSGNYVWAKRVGAGASDFGNGLGLDGSGNVYATGYFQGTNVDFDPGAGTANLTSAGGQDIFIAKYDASGNYVWAKRVGGTSGDIGYGLTLDGSGNVHVTGFFQGANIDFDPGAGTANLMSAGSADIFIAKYDASGNYTWAKRVGGPSDDIGYGLVLDGSGNVHVTGSFAGAKVDFDPGAGMAELSAGAGSDAFALRLSSAGNYDWAINWGQYGTQPSSMQCRAIARDASGNVYATGSFQGTNVDFDPGAGTANLTSAGGLDIFIAKYDASGNYLWAKQVGGTSSDIGYGLAVDGSGNVHVTGVFVNTVDFDPGAGTANLTSAGGGDIFIAKYDASGNYVWANRVGGPNSDSGLGLAVDGSGNVHLTGFFTNTVDFDPGAGTANLVSVGAGDIFIAKYDASGNYVWAKGVGGASGDDIGSGIGLDGNGNIYLTGYFQGTNLDFDPGAGTANLTSAGVFDIFIAKYDASGNYVWANRVGGTSADISYGLALDGSGNMHITGYFEGANVDFDPGAGTANLVSVGAGDIFIAKYDASGNYVWANRVGGASTDIGRGIALDGSGNVHVTGFFLGSDVDFDPGAGTANLTSAGGADIFIAKYDPSGNYLLAMPAGNSSDDQGFCITAGGAGKINAGGHFGGTVDFDPGAGTANRTAVSSNYDIFIAQYSTAPTGIVISGNIEHHNGAPSGTGVKDVTVTLSGADTGSDLTPASGDYEFSTTATGDFTVAPTKSLNKLNGVTVADAVAIQQHLTGSTPIASNYLKVAADVNKSNSISTIDATVINQSLLGNPTALAQFKTSWRFVPQSHTMSDPPWGFPENISLTAVTSDQTGQDFYGIKTGDLVAAYANPAGFKGGAPMTLRVQDILLHAGQTAELVFRTGQLDDLAAFQLALHFDPQTLELLEIQPLDALPLTADHFGLFGIAQGEIRVVWSQPEGMALEEGSPLFTLRFKALQSGLWMSELLFLDDAVLPAYAYNAVLDESAVSLDFDLNTATISQDVAAGLQLRQNRPNPFDRETTIGFVLPEACDAQLRVFDVNGIELLRINKAYGAGNHEETLRLEHAGGVLFCELATPYGVVVRKMMVVKN